MKRRRRPAEEGDGYYASMTDMMVGVIFILILLVAFLGMNFRDSVSRLTQARDAETAALLEQATDLQPVAMRARLDRERRIVCLPADVLAGGATVAEAGVERCFAYGTLRRLTDAPTDRERDAASVRRWAAQLQDTLLASGAPVLTQDAPTLIFDADAVFAPGTSILTDDGEAAVARTAALLAARAPCLGYLQQRSDMNCADLPPLSQIAVNASVASDADTAEGRQALTLAFERSARFRQALLAAEPSLAALRDNPNALAGGPLIQATAYGRSQAAEGRAVIRIDFIPREP